MGDKIEHGKSIMTFIVEGKTMWEEENIRVEIMLLWFWRKCILNSFFLLNLLPKRLKAINILLEAEVLGFVTFHNCKVLLWSAQL